MDDNKLLETIETRVREHVDVKRVWCDVVRKGVSSARLLRAPNDYYDWKLSQRALFLNCSIPQLTKSIIVENVAYSKRDCSDPLNSRYYCIIIQYIAKLNSEKLLREVRKFCSEGKEICLSKKYFNFQHAPAEISEQLTGFCFNAVSPFGLRTKIPVIVAKDILDLETPYIWMGGGAATVKLGVSSQQLVRTLGARVASVTDPRIDTL